MHASPPHPTPKLNLNSITVEVINSGICHKLKKNPSGVVATSTAAAAAGPGTVSDDERKIKQEKRDFIH